MADRSATIKVGVEGADEAASAAGKVKDAWVKAGGDSAKAFQTFGNTVTGAITGMVSDLTRLATVAQGISFGKGLEGAREYQQTIGRMATSVGSDAKHMRDSFEYLSKKNLVPEQQIIGFVGSVRKLTYDAQGAAQAFSGLADEALATGRTTDDMVPLGATLKTTLGVTGDTTEALGRMRAQAEAFGTIGGPAALQDSLVGVRDVLSQISGDAGNVTSLLAGLGKGLNAQQSQRVFSGVMGKMLGDQIGLKYLLGDKAYKQQFDEHGHVKDPTKLMEDYKTAAIKRYGAADFRRRAILDFGLEGGNAIANANFEEIRKNAHLTPSTDAAKIADTFRKGEAGEALKGKQARDRAERKVGESIQGTADTMQGFMAEHPIAGMLGLNVGGGLLGAGINTGMNAGMNALGSALFGTTQAATGLGAATTVATPQIAGLGASALTTIGGLAAAGAAGYAFGSFLDNTFHISDLLSGTGTHSRIKEEDDAEFAKDEARRDAKRRDKANAGPSLRHEESAEPEKPGSTVVDLPGQGSSVKLAPVTFTIVNKTGGPIEVVDGSKAAGGGKQ